MAVLEAIGSSSVTVTATGSAVATVSASGFAIVETTAVGTASRTPSVIPLAKGSNLITRGFGPAGGGGGPGGGSNFTIYQTDLLVASRLTANFSTDMLVITAPPATVVTESFSTDMVVSGARSITYATDFLVINEYNPGDADDTHEEWNDTFI